MKLKYWYQYRWLDTFLHDKECPLPSNLSERYSLSVEPRGLLEFDIQTKKTDDPFYLGRAFCLTTIDFSFTWGLFPKQMLHFSSFQASWPIFLDFQGRIFYKRPLSYDRLMRVFSHIKSYIPIAFVFTITFSSTPASFSLTISTSPASPSATTLSFLPTFFDLPTSSFLTTFPSFCRFPSFPQDSTHSNREPWS